MHRNAFVIAVLVMALAAALLVGESLLPGRVLLPLLPDDFPDWSVGRAPEDLVRHPTPNWSMSDVLHLLVPGYAVTRGALERGELPLWDPSQALGVPHIDQVHYGVFYPPAWLPVAFGFPALGWLAAFHLVAAGLGMWLYLGALGRSPHARVLGACCFLAGAWFTARLHNGSVAGAAAWLPWILAGLERGAGASRTRGYALAAVATALSWLAGFPQVTVLVLCTAGVLELGRAVTTTCVARDGRRAASRFAWAMGALLLGALLAAPQLVPTVEYLFTQSSRVDQSPELLALEGLEWPLLKHLLVPDYYAAAHVNGVHPLALGALRQAVNFAALNRPEVSMAIGTPGLLLALAAMLFGRRWITRAWTGLVLVLFALLLLPQVFTVVATLLPPLRLGNPKRLLLITSFGLAVLAAGGFDLVRKGSMRVATTAWLLSLLAMAGACVLMLAVPSTAESASMDRWAVDLARQMDMPQLGAEDVYRIVPAENFRAASDAAFGGASLAMLMALAGVLLFRPRATITPRQWTTHAARRPALVLVLVLAELILVGRPLLRAAPMDAVTSQPGRIDRLAVPALVSAVRAATPGSAAPVRMARVGNEPSWLRPNLPGIYGLHDVQAYAPMVPRRVAELLGAAAPEMVVSGSALGGVDDASLGSPVLDMLSVGIVLSHHEGTLPAGFVETERVGHVRVLRNDEALPRAWFVPGAGVTKIESDEERLAACASGDFDPRAAVFVEQDVDLPESEKGPAVRAVEVESYGPGSVRVTFGRGQPGLLVLAEGFDPRWTAHVAHDGGAERWPAVLRADHALMAVPLRDASAGVVTLAFGMGSLSWALIVGGVAWLLWLVLAAWPVRAQEIPVP